MHPIHTAILVLSLVAPSAAQSSADYSGDAYTDFLGTYERLEFIEDTDGDGVRDLVGWWRSQNGGPVRVRTYRPNLSRQSFWYDEHQFTPSVSFQAANATAAGDIDGDGALDAVVVYGWEIYVLRDFGDGVEPSETIDTLVGAHWPQVGTSANPGTLQVVLADLDGDGRDSVILIDNRRAFVYAVDASGLLAPDFSVDLTGGASEPMRIAVGDMDADGDEDVVILRSDLAVHRVSVYLRDDLTNPEIHRHDLATPNTELAVGDVDGDGDDDAIVFGLDSSCQHFEHVNGTLIPRTIATGGPATHFIDLDGDGDLDGACCGGGGGGGISNHHPSTFQVCFNDGAGNFSISTEHGGLGAHHLAGAFDWDGDGDLDLLGGRALLLNHERLGYAYCPGQINSTAQPGRLGFTGSARRSADNLVGHVTGLPPTTVGIMAVSRGHTDPVTLGEGTLCLSGGIGFTRMRLFTSGPNGTANYDVWQDPPQVQYGPWNAQYAVESWYFQAWYRDGSAQGTPTSNLTNAVQIYLVR